MHSLRTITPLALLGLLGLFTLAACSSGPPKPEVDFNREFDFSQAKTVAFYRNSGQVSGDNPLQLSDMQRNRVDKAVRVAVDNRGFTFLADASKADLLLTWHLVTQQKTDVRSTQSVSMGMGYGGGYGRYNRYSNYNCWSCSPTQTQVSVSNYTEGTFIVDLIDPASGQSVWRAVTQSKLKGKTEHQEARYNEAAALIFASFPPQSYSTK
ncbi:MAG: hypothetical protein ACI8QT_000355 [Halioglobus sp.]|jgi:hypothetical protein